MARCYEVCPSRTIAYPCMTKILMSTSATKKNSAHQAPAGHGEASPTTADRGLLAETKHEVADGLLDVRVLQHEVLCM